MLVLAVGRMSPVVKNEPQRFWTTLFEENRLSSKLYDLAALQEKGQHFPVSIYGNVLVRAQPASALGDNFMSDTFVVEATLEDGAVRRSFVKVLPSNAIMREAAYASKVHHREVSMYETFFDLLRQLRDNAGLSADQVPLHVANTYYVHIEDIVKGETDGSGIAVVIEDFKWQGYGMVDKYAGCDYEHANMALTTLAHYHALTIAFVRKNLSADGVTINYPPGAEFLAEPTLFDISASEMIAPWLQVHIDMFKLLNRHDNSEWLKDIQGRVLDIVRNENVAELGPLACILHGDFWSNNMLFKHNPNEKGKPIGFKMIDFQIARLNHPLYDILYFLYSSTTPEFREVHMNQLLKNYFFSVSSSLKLLGVDLEKEGYGEAEFFAEYKKKCINGMLMGLMVIPMILDKKVVGDLKNLDQEIKEAKAEEKETDEEVVKGVSGMSLETEQKMMTLLSPEQIAANELVRHRIVKLIDEVKRLTA